jgi:hypothetical protein
MILPRKINMKKTLYASVELGLICILLLSSIRSVHADSTTLYLDWKLENGDSAGHMTISGYPTAIEENQTYKVEITLTHEKGAIPDFKYLNFTVDGINNVDPIFLGYSSINSVLEKNATTLISHWKTQDIPTNQKEGALKIITDNNETVITTPELIAVKFKTTNTLKLIPPNSLNKGDVMTVKGNITMEGESVPTTGIIINLAYLNPNGTEILRKVTVDENGNFMDRYVPNLDGTWWIKASWNGTEKYSRASSSTYSFEVYPQIPFWLYLGIAGLILWVAVSLPILKWYFKTEQIYP